MTVNYDLIDTFSRRPSLAPVAYVALREALRTQYPSLNIDPAIAVIIHSQANDGSARTLMDVLRDDFATGKTPHWTEGECSLVLDPASAEDPVAPLDLEQLAVLVDTVSLGLPNLFMRAMVSFWDRPGKNSASPWKQLAEELELRSSSATPPSGLPGTGVAPADAGVDFENKALEVLEGQLLLIHGVMSLGFDDFDEIERYLAKVTDIAPQLGIKPTVASPSQPDRFEQLPDWLRSASSVDRLDYSCRLAAVAVAAGRSAGACWNDNLPGVLDYARKVMQDKLREDHPQATSLTLDDVTVNIAKVVAVPAPSTGQIIAIGSIEHLHKSVAVFALENLSSVPNGTITLSIRDGGPLPGWLTPDYVKQLVVRVDIGRTYPALVRHYLLDDHAEAARRQTLFADQLRVQLPLKALEQKIRGQGDLTQAGYRLICSLLEGNDDDVRHSPSPCVLRPLAWVARPGATADEVSNMFIIGASAPTVGPFVLYRPFADVPLTEFPTWTQLRDAIANEGELQHEVLTWMSAHARRCYGNGGFNQPHILRFGLGFDYAPLETPAPAQLDVDVIQGDVMVGLFNANARALVDLADRESVSNAESRWALLQRGGWLALDAVLPFFTGPAGSALWLVQMMEAVDRVLVAQAGFLGTRSSEAWSALLLNISMILLHEGFARSLPSSTRLGEFELPLTEPISQTQSPLEADEPEPAPAPAQVPAPTFLDFSWSSSSHRLTAEQAARLEQLKVTPEPALGETSSEPGKEGLYRHDERWWVRLESGVYEVGFSESGTCIRDPLHPASYGPRLRHTGQGWILDLSLGLRGGGPKRSARQLALENAENLRRVTGRGAILEERLSVLYRSFSQWEQTRHTDSEPLTQDQMESVATDLNEIWANLQEQIQLQASLRPADRVAEKVIAKSLQGVGQRIGLYEGVLLECVVHVVETELPRLQALSPDKVTPENVDTYLALFGKLLSIKDRGERWATVREEVWLQLKNVPKVGKALWRADLLMLHSHNLFTRLDWRINRMWTLLELSFTREAILTAKGATELKNFRTDEDLHAAFSSHAELEKPNDYSLAEQIGVLESSMREYQRAMLVAVCTEENTPQALQPEQFGRFVEDLDWIYDHAEARMSDLIRESAEPPEQPSEYVPRVTQPRKRVIKTRAHRTLVGRLREGEPDLPGAVVDVTEPMSDTVVGTYHLHESGEWVELETVPAAKPAGRTPTVALAELKRQALAGLERVEVDIASARRQSRRGGEPADMEDILVHRADTLNELADKLAARLAGSRSDQSAASSVQTMMGQLRTAASRLKDEGRALRIAMIKAQPPTAARLSYLAREHEVSIARFEGRKNMSGRKRNDFVQEYQIRDQEQRVLWWAHFHYASEGAAADAFTAAHLKLPEQRLIGYKAQVKAAKDNKEVIAVYRSVIGKDVAQRLFLSLAG